MHVLPCSTENICICITTNKQYLFPIGFTDVSRIPCVLICVSRLEWKSVKKCTLEKKTKGLCYSFNILYLSIWHLDKHSTLTSHHRKKYIMMMHCSCKLCALIFFMGSTDIALHLSHISVVSFISVLDVYTSWNKKKYYFLVMSISKYIAAGVWEG